MTNNFVPGAGGAGEEALRAAALSAIRLAIPFEEPNAGRSVAMPRSTFAEVRRNLARLIRAVRAERLRRGRLQFTPARARTLVCGGCMRRGEIGVCPALRCNTNSPPPDCALRTHALVIVQALNHVLNFADRPCQLQRPSDDEKPIPPSPVIATAGQATAPPALAGTW